MKTRTEQRPRAPVGFLAALILAVTSLVAWAVMPPSAIMIFQPDPGAKYTVPGPVLIQVASNDPQGAIPHVDFFANDVLIGSGDYQGTTPPAAGQSIPFRFTWTNVVAGSYKITARGLDSAGKLVVSPTVDIVVTEAIVPPVPPTPTNAVLVPKGAVWRWAYDGVDQQDAWRAPSFDATKWKSGKAQLGFGEGDEATVIYTGKSPYPITAYFLTEFQVPADAGYSKLVVKLLRDDGAVVYLNNKEIVRDNMPSGTITYASKAVQATEGLAFRETTLAASGLVAGRNVIAVEVHQYAVTSSDLSFDLELDGIVPSGPALPVVSLVASRPATAEPSPTTKVAPGQFTVKRTGSTTLPLAVFLSYGGTAEPGLDYTRLPVSLEIPAGKGEATLDVVALADELVEARETVVAKLVTSSPLVDPAPGSVAPTYSIDPKLASAEVVIADTTTPAPAAKLAITNPPNGASLPEGVKIAVKATAMDPKGYVNRVEFFDGTTRIGVSEIVFIRAPDPGTVIEHSVDWTATTVGAHKLSATATSSVGTPLKSEVVAVTITNTAPAVPSLVIQSPKPNAEFAWGDPIRILAIGTLPGGTMTRVEFLDGDQVIGVSELRMGVLWIPGMPHEHLFVWSGAASGAHQLSARYTDAAGSVVRSSPVPIKVLDAPEPVVIEVVAATPEATEPTSSSGGMPGGTGMAGKNGAFLIRRVSGPTNITLNVGYQMSGGASNGVDYARLDGTVVLPKNRVSVEVALRPLADLLKEGDEKAVLTLTTPVCAAIFPPPPECYQLGKSIEAAVVIHDAKVPNVAPKVVINSPKHGTVTTVGTPIVFKATATDADGSIARLDLLADGKVIASDTNATFTFAWTNAAKGTHKLTAKATDNEGASTTSSSVVVNVRALTSVAFVTRDLPASYQPGTNVDVVLNANPPKTAGAWAVEETVPPGWVVKLGSISATVDAANGVLRFGPFTDAVARTLAYTVTPPLTAQGVQKFTGTTSLDGKTLPVVGDTTILVAGEFHPADATPADHSISTDELTAYAGAWITGKNWGTDSAPIPLSYVTRAGLIWQKGGKYSFNPAKGAPPECWVPAGASMMSAGVSTRPMGSAMRQSPVSWSPGAPGTVTLEVMPPMGSAAMAVMDTVPEGWSVTRVDGGGHFDPASGQVRWGLIFGDTPCNLSYEAVPPANAASNGQFSGEVSFDGMRVPILGKGSAGASNASTAMRIAGSRRGNAGHVHFTVEAPAEQVFAVEASKDLVNWSEVDAFVFTGEELDVQDPAVDANPTRYYRLRPIGQ